MLSGVKPRVEVWPPIGPACTVIVPSGAALKPVGLKPPARAAASARQIAACVNGTDALMLLLCPEIYR